MALQFTDAGQVAEAAAPIVGPAFTLAGLYRFSTPDGGTILGLGGGTSNYVALAMLGTGQGFFEVSGGGTADAFATGTFSTGPWHSLVGVENSDASRVFYADGVAGAVNTSTLSPGPSARDRVTVGMLKASGNYISSANGDVAEVAVWDVALTAAEAAMLAAFVCPLLVRPDHLVLYSQLRGEASTEIEPDRIGGRDLVWDSRAAWKPVVATHPAVLMPPTGPVVPSQGTFPTITAPTDDFSVVESPLSLARGWAQNRYFAGPGSDMLQSDGAVAFSQQIPSGTFYSQVRDAVVGPDTEVGVRINAKPPDGTFVVGLLARLVNDGTLSVTGYGLYIHAEAGGDTWQLYRISGLTFDPLGAAAGQEVAVGDHVGLEVRGTSAVNLVAHHCPAGLDPATATNWAPVVQRPDTSAFGSPLITAGRTGMEVESSSGRFARWFDGTTGGAGAPDLAVAPAGIGSAEALGTPAVVPGTASVAPAGIASAEALGSPVVAPGAVNLGAGAIPSAEAFGALSVAPGPVSVAIPGIASAEALGIAVVAPGTASVAPTGILSAEAFGASGLAPAAGVAPAGIASSEALGTPVLAAALDFDAPRAGHTVNTRPGHPTRTLSGRSRRRP